MLKCTIIQNDDTPLFEQGSVLMSFYERVRGLIGRKELDHNEAWVFPQCKSIHTFFMRMPIDVIWLDKENRVIDVKTLRPWHLPVERRHACAVIEARAGVAEERVIVPGSTVTWKISCMP